jgi:hypothetical protein
MKKKIVVKDLVLENRKMQDVFKKRLNEGFFDNVLKKVGMGEPEKVKEKKVSTMTPKEKELYDKAIAAAGTAAEDGAWAAYEAEKYGGEDKSPLLGKQETPMAQELQKKTIEDYAEEHFLRTHLIKLNGDGTMDYGGNLDFWRLAEIKDDKGNPLFPVKFCHILSVGPRKEDPFQKWEKFTPQECGEVQIDGGKNGQSPWMEKYKNKAGVIEYVKSKTKTNKVTISYVFDSQMDRNADYDTEMRR